MKSLTLLCSFYCLQSAWCVDLPGSLSVDVSSDKHRDPIVLIGWRPSDEHVGESLRRNDQTRRAASTTNPVSKITGFCSSRESLTEGTDLPFSPASRDRLHNRKPCTYRQRTLLVAPRIL